ncbi:hypothetical protein EHS25_003038 [Saitozyma podzolica]|uniref:Rho GDP-dissociation inhibitor n=1 Tax=Saitozyma podzolica TaxID=1890683 RepID=A0A427YCF0_9TREE|nr:hypothetical protein EHS25_003038 [Saitozyma podzolica]
MSHAQDAHDDELAPTMTEGYKAKRSVAELAELDKEDESLQRWKQSLLGAGAGASSGDKKVVPKTLFLTSPTLQKEIIIDLTLPPAELAKMTKAPITIKEGVEYSVGITFVVENQIVSGLKYLQAVKRAGIKVRLGRIPSGMLARSGSYVVKSRIIDDDKKVWLDFEWGFKLAKEW